MASSLGYTASFGRSVADSASQSPPNHELDLDALETFQFSQVFLTNGKTKQLVIPLTVKDPADANMAAAARKKLLEDLAQESKVITYIDIKNMTMKVRGPKGELVTEEIPMSEEVRTLRGVYDRLARANEIPVSWDSKVSPSLVCPPGRIQTINSWPVGKMITTLKITDNDKIKRAEAIDTLRTEMEKAIDPNEASLSQEDKDRRTVLRNYFGACSSLALVANAGGVSRAELEAAVKEKEKDSFIQGTILGLTDGELTLEEQTYLTDIELLGVKKRAELVEESHKRGRPVPQDSFERVFLGAFDEALNGKVLDQVVENFCQHPLVAAIGLKGPPLEAFKEKFKTELGEAIRTVGVLPSAHFVQPPTPLDLDLDFS